MSNLAFTLRPFALAVLLGATLLALSAARADEGVMLAQSSAHKLEVFADGGAGWCGAHVSLRMVVAPDSPDAGKPAAQVEMMNRLKQPLKAACAAATSADIAVIVGVQAQGRYHATKAGNWMFTTAAGRLPPASLDTPNDQPGAATAAPAPPVSASYPGDAPGSKDPPGFKRIEGSTILAYTTRSFDQYTLARGNGAPAGGFAKSEVVEGAITRVVYRVPAGRTSLEVLRNYEQMLESIGIARNFEIAPCDLSGGTVWTSYFSQKFSHQAGIPPEEIYTPIYPEGDGQCYFTARGVRDGQQIDVAVFVVTNAEWSFIRGREPKRIPISKGEVLAAVDVIVSKPMANSMVEVKATDMADALSSKGSIDLYGILFDTDKTDIKPESAKTLDEVASLLKIDRSLKLEISGHTDNAGDKAHNLKLSEGRAQAVVDVLVKNYGIDPARMEAKGYGDTMPVVPNDSDANKAKNRRVELRKL